MQELKFWLVAMILSQTSSPSSGEDWQRAIGICDSGTDIPNAVSDCTDLIGHWMLKEPLPTNPELTSSYYRKGATLLAGSILFSWWREWPGNT
ncbi:MAG: hypothetical protein WBX25_07640 [Rhodomicrobium sp.]